MSLYGTFSGELNRPYCGVQVDIVLMRRYRGGAYTLALDVPFSAVMDTALLPITVPGYFIFPPEPLDWTTREQAFPEEQPKEP